ncbi:Hsp20 family protein [Caulobacter segnis]
MSTAFDFTPLYSSMIGVDRMVDLVETALRSGASASYPPYDIEKTGEDAYRISLALAGFAPSDLEIVAEPNLLVIKGQRPTRDGQGGRSFLHQGLAQRAFERRFELADYVVVKDASHAHGVLSIDLAREVPQALKPRQIPIRGGAAQQALELKPAKARKAA